MFFVFFVFHRFTFTCPECTNEVGSGYCGFVTFATFHPRVSDALPLCFSCSYHTIRNHMYTGSGQWCKTLYNCFWFAGNSIRPLKVLYIYDCMPVFSTARRLNAVSEFYNCDVVRCAWRYVPYNMRSLDLCIFHTFGIRIRFIANGKGHMT